MKKRADVVESTMKENQKLKADMDEMEKEEMELMDQVESTHRRLSVSM